MYINKMLIFRDKTRCCHRPKFRNQITKNLDTVKKGKSLRKEIKKDPH